MLKTFLKRSLKYASFSLLTIIVLSGCSNNAKPNNNTANTTQTQNTKEETTNFDEISNKFISQIEEKIVKNWPNLNKIWPDLDFSNNSTVIFLLGNDGKAIKAWAIDISGKKELSSSEYSKLNYPDANGFSKDTFNGKDSIFVSLSAVNNEIKEIIDTYEYATHELIHAYHQPKDYIEGSRNQKYPIEYEPRIYRTMIYRNLSNALTADDDNISKNHIQKAAYWFNKWKNEYPNEYEDIRTTDIFEGHAQYVAKLADLTNKDKITKEDFSKKINPNAILTNLGTDSYDLGFVALALLDRNDPNFKNDFFKLQKSPIELLLENVTPVEDIADENLSTEIKKQIDKVNSETKTFIENILTSLNDKSIPYLKVNSDYIEGSIGVAGFYSYNDLEIFSKFSAKYNQDSSNSLSVNELSIITNPNNKVDIIPLTEKFEINGDTLTLKGKNLNGTLKVTTSIEDGRTVYIAK